MRYSGNILKLTLAAAAFTWCMVVCRTPVRHVATRTFHGEHERDAVADRGLPPHRTSSAALLKFFSEERTASSLPWVPLSVPNFSGRITAIVLSPGHPDTILAGAADGGIWRSIDGGNNFSPTFDDAPTLSIGSLAFDPVHPNIAYAGTGEVNANLDSYPGVGLYKSTDAGATWQATGLSAVPYLSSIVINPQNTNELFVAGMGALEAPDTVGGVFHSTDGGNSWGKIFSPGDSVGVIDLKYLPTATPILLCAAWQRLGGGGQFGARSAVYRSTNMGRSWNKVAGGLPESDSLTGRIAIATALSNPNVVYAAIEEEHLQGNFLIDDFGGIYKSTDAGISWMAVSGYPGTQYDYRSGQGWYNKTLAVNPLDENAVLFGDIEMYYTTDAGTTWANISNAYGSPNNTHADQHAIAYNILDTATIFAGNDGGIYKIRFDSAWQFLPIPVTQFYSSAIDSNRAWFAIGGTQDNGLLLYNDTTTTDWKQPRALFGDMASIGINPSNSGTIFAEHTYMRIVFTGDGVDKSMNGGFSWINMSAGIGGNDAAAVPPLLYDLRDTNTLYTATDKVYRTTNGGGEWSAISSRLMNDTFGFITTLAISANSEIFIAGANDGTMSLSTNGGSAWQTITSPVPGAWVASVLYDDVSGSLYAGMANSNSMQNLYRSTNEGSSWQSLSAPASNFPPVSVNAIVVDDKNDSIIIAGTDVGVYVTRDLGGSWEPLGAGLPHAAVAQLNINRRTRILRAATHGRDMWQFDLGTWEQSTAVKEPVPENFVLDLQAFPNPFTNTVTIISAAGMEGETTFEIVDLTGTVQRMYTGRGERVSFDVSTLPSGIYFARVQKGSWSALQKILLVR
ncbi:MAG TPA: T9SS type A sorting domain-containing protein [Candidatus Kapabacteria bacterium]|nr:T9SS type A sorting domain-containing protein [Candidatus Kapabacteria bacterium]